MADALVNGQPFKQSENDYDWLGSGIYFWESNPRRGFEFARELAERKSVNIVTPAVIGAVIDLGNCLDLATASGIEMVKVSFEILKKTSETRKSNSRRTHTEVTYFYAA